MRLTVVRRLEAAGFRAWPATSTFFDGTWAVRITTSFPAKRLNSVNPLDRSDHADMAGRLARAGERFAAVGRPLIVRQSPLCPPALVDHLDAEGWSRFGEAVVYTAVLADLDLSGAIDRIPIHDGWRYLDASLVVHERPAALREGLAEVLNAIRPPASFFVRESEGGDPVAVALAITDNDLAGILDVAVLPKVRRQGIARDLVVTALRHTLHRGARTGWLQVEADNAAGLALYRNLGFAEAYRYCYRAPPGVIV
ncbi:GNAT family N-acetyltransferase [Aureimonas pseudogalii]|uniref:Ribosomal protein S18 acetylase RimI-like enzyme n=1 Tax=Aureimonas pseudogalii TaxID=1744844 RepID=A0A7W6EEC9_9HYPH|nr:GNAT family N-acetyltransferase [Aureimonas pseudogalii]MBB3996239.1 ribosomal protein S18 acetylase RimI-like enzyme [Aureimonas pseudogalii]